MRHFTARRIASGVLALSNNVTFGPGSAYALANTFELALGPGQTTLGNVAYLAARLGDGQRAPAIYDALMPFAAVFGSTTVVRPVGSHFLGMLAVVCDRRDDAAGHFTDAIAAHERGKAPLVRAETQLEYGNLLRDTDGDDEVIAQLLDEVRTTAKQSGASYLSARCDLLA